MPGMFAQRIKRRRQTTCTSTPRCAIPAGRVSVYDNLSLDWKYWFVDIIFICFNIYIIYIYRLGKASINKIRCGDTTYCFDSCFRVDVTMANPPMQPFVFDRREFSDYNCLKKRKTCIISKVPHKHHMKTFFCNMLSVWSHRIIPFPIIQLGFSSSTWILLRVAMGVMNETSLKQLLRQLLHWNAPPVACLAKGKCFLGHMDQAWTKPSSLDCT